MKKQQTTVEKIIPLYPDLSIIDIIFCRLRFLILPVDDIIKQTPRHGNLLDIGCGYGFVTNAIAISRPYLELSGIDIDKYRISIAQQTIKSRDNINFSVADLRNGLVKKFKFNTILSIDLLHHIEKRFHNRIIKDVYNRLKKNGTFIIKDIDTKPFYKYCCNYLHDLIVNKGQLVYCRSHLEWISILIKKGFQIKSLTFPKKGLLYPHFMIVAVKP